ncbi:MAG TPA: LLM class flavin-dependent oxidoreductase [Dehalococcoidia bacterium]|nr:LLM class flavin-dependent oxidoreductase [Dehalococcoidia bacterium]
MKVSIAFGGGRDWDQSIDFALEAERLGVEYVWTGEAWGYDAFTPLAYMASRVKKAKMGTSIMQTGTRSPSVVAMTALSLASMTNDRFILGMGTSGPQVIEGWHGLPFKQPVQRMKEIVEIVRIIARGERLEYEGRVYQNPLTGSGRRALKGSTPPREIPIYLATLGPTSLEMTGEVADGWLASSFMPDHADVFFDHIRAGAQRAGRSFEDLDLQAGGVVSFSDDLEKLIPQRKPGFAFEIGAMGSPTQNFYRDAYVRQGYGELTAEVLRLWLDRKREEAAALIPNDFVLKANLLGTEEMVKERIRVYRDAGVTTIRANPEGESMADRLDTLGRFMELIKEVDAER